MSRPALRSALVLTGVTGLLTTGFLGTSAATANAAEPCVPSADGRTVTCTYADTGVGQTFVVPDGVTNVDVTVTGVAGNPEVDSTTADQPAAGSGILAVAPGSTLLIGFGHSDEFVGDTAPSAPAADPAPGLEVESGSGDSGTPGNSPVGDVPTEVVDSWRFAVAGTDRVASIQAVDPADLTLRDVIGSQADAARGGRTESVVPAALVLAYAVAAQVPAVLEAPAWPRPSPSDVPAPTEAPASPEVTMPADVPAVPEAPASPEETVPEETLPEETLPEETVPVEVPAVPESPASPEDTLPVEVPAVPEAPASPRVTVPAEVPVVPAAPEVTEPVVTAAPAAPEVAAPFEVPAAPEAAVPAEVPTVTEAPASPEVPLPVEVPAATKAPASPLTRIAAPTPLPGRIQAGSPEGETAEPLVVGDLETAASAVPSALFDTSGVGLIASLLGGMVAVALCAGVILGVRQRNY